MAKIELVINAETAKGIRQIVNMAKAQDQVERSTDRAGKSAGKQARETNLVADAAGRAGKEFFRMMAAFASADTVVQAIKRIAEALKELEELLADRGRKQASLGELSAQLRDINPDDPTVTGKAVKHGAAFGQQPETALRTIQTLQSSGSGVFEDALKDSEAAFNLMLRGVSEEAAIASVQAFLVAGRRGVEAANSLQISGEKSSMSAVQISRIAEAFTSFGEKDAPYVFPIGAALSRTTPEAQIPTAARQVGQTLYIPNEFNKFLTGQLQASNLAAAGKSEREIADELGMGKSESELKKVREMLALKDVSGQFGTDYTQLDAMQRLNLIREVIPGASGTDTADIAIALEKFGLDDKESLRRMSALLEDRTFTKMTEDTIPTIEQAPETYLADKIQRDREVDLAYAKHLATVESQARLAAQQVLDPDAAKADLELKAIGARISERTGGAPSPFVAEEGAKAGETGWWGKRIFREVAPEFREAQQKSVMTEMGPVSAEALNLPPPQQPSTLEMLQELRESNKRQVERLDTSALTMEQAEGLKRAIEANTAAVDRNNQLTERNSTAVESNSEVAIAITQTDAPRSEPVAPAGLRPTE